MIHNGFEWECHPNDCFMIRDYTGCEPVGQIALFRENPDSDIWTGKVTFGDWYDTQIVMNSKKVVMTLVENTYRSMARGITDTHIWTPLSETESVRETCCCKGAIGKDDGYWFGIESGDSPMEKVSFDDRQSALLVGNLVVDSYLESNRGGSHA